MLARARARAAAASESAICSATRFLSRRLSGFEMKSANSSPICLVRSSSEMNFCLQVLGVRMLKRSDPADGAILAC